MNPENELFVKEFNHFKDHPEDYKIKKEGVLELSIFLFVVGFLGMFIYFNSMKGPLNDLLALVPLGYLAIGGIAIYMLAAHINVINKRIYVFKQMVYKEKASELFGNLNHPVMKKFKDTLINDFQLYNGIRGVTAYNIYYHMTDDKIKKVLKEKEIASRALEEIENI